MKLWTFQSIEWWQLLECEGVLRTAHSAERVDILSQWIADQLTKRIAPPPGGVTDPIWGWHKQGGKTAPSPKMRWSSSVWEHDEFVRMQINVPDREVLLSDPDRWDDIIFFGGFVPGGNWGQLYALEKDMQAAGFMSDILLEGLDCDRAVNLPHFVERDQIKAALQHEKLGPRIRQTWEAIFDFTFDYGRARTGPRKDRVQAMFWELRLDQVINVRHFHSDQPTLLSSAE